MDPVPYPVFEAAVSVAGSALHWKSSLKQLLRNAGVSEAGWAQYQDETKYKIIRSLWADLDNAGQRGRKVQHAIVQQLATLHEPDAKVPEPQAGRDAIRELRELALRAEILVSPSELARRQRAAAAEAAQAQRTAREEQIAALHGDFLALQGSDDAQGRGYKLERLLSALSRLDELEYQGSYRTDTDQVDGAVTIDSFTYLIEAKWRTETIPQSEIDGFVGKVERRIEATRGVYVAINGFRPEVIDRYRLTRDNRIIFLDGADLAWILEGRMSFAEVLRGKVRAASVQGEPFRRAAEL